MPKVDADPLISVSGLTAGYPGKPVIEALDLTILPGSLTVLIGPNGCGKSTLLRCLAGLLMPTAGTIELARAPLSSLSRKALARRIAFLPQSPSAPAGLTVRDIVRQGRYAHRSLFGGWSRADETAFETAMEMAGICDLRDRELATLSGGQRQRAWIAMTLAQDADILLLDEPTSFLDIAHQVDVLKLLRKFKTSGKTMVVVLHDLNQALRLADRLVAMKGGRIVTAASPASALPVLEGVFDLPLRFVVDPADDALIVVPAGTADGPRAAG